MTGLSGLSTKFVAKGKKFWGTCGDSSTLNIAANANIIKSEFGALTPENSMKVSYGLVIVKFRI